MSNTSINLDEAKESLDSISPLYRRFVERALEEVDPQKIEEIAYSMTGEKPETGFIIGLGAATPKDSLWQRVLDEVYDFLCTNSSAYKEERSKGASHFQNLVGIIAASIGATIHVGVGILSGLVSIALILISKIGKNAWCQLNTARRKG